jgi:lysine decarboxylase
VRAAVEEIDGLHVNDRDDFCGPGLADDFDPLPCVIDVTGLGIPGYQAADWLRERRGVVAHLTDHRRIGMQLTHADDRETTGELLSALKELARSAPELDEAPRVALPVAAELRMDRQCCPGTRSSGRPRRCRSAGGRPDRRGDDHAVSAGDPGGAAR